MKLEGRHDVRATPEIVWDALLDAELLAAAVPGCDALRKVRDHVYEGSMQIGIGALRGRFSGTVELTELEAPAACRFSLSARRGPSEFVTGSGRLRLADDGAATTTLSYDVEILAGGRLAAVGQRLLSATATTLIRRSLASFEEKLLERHGPRSTDG